MIAGSLILILLTGSTLGIAADSPKNLRTSEDSNDKYAQIYLPPISYVGPPVVVGPPVYTTTYYNPPVYLNPPPVILPPGPMIIRYPGRPFLRTFIP